MESNDATANDRFKINHPSVISEQVTGQTIVINFDTGRYFSLNESASVIWQLISNGLSVQEMCERVQMPSAQQMAGLSAKLESFLAALSEADLIRSADSAISQVVPEDDRLPLSIDQEPRLEVFSDLQDILLMDPIHEVDEQGWPHAAPPQSV